MSFVKPHQVAKALGITTSALRMRRFRGSETIDYIVNNRGRVMYKADSLEAHINSFSSPQRVSKPIKNVTESYAFKTKEEIKTSTKVNQTLTKPNRQSHDDLKKDHQYMHTIGKVNERRIQDKVDRLLKQKLQQEENRKALRARMAEQKRTGRSEDRSERDYVHWTNPNTVGNYWNSIEEYENSKKKKKFTGYY